MVSGAEIGSLGRSISVADTSTSRSTYSARRGANLLEMAILTYGMTMEILPLAYDALIQDNGLKALEYLISLIRLKKVRSEWAMTRRN